MENFLKIPGLVLLGFLFLLLVSALIGARLHSARRVLKPDERDDLGIVLGATLTLLGLIIGFTFSMAVSRYDQRKSLEEEEANAIGTEFLRADLLPARNGAKVRRLLGDYLDQRIRFYQTRDSLELEHIDTSTGRLQNQLWSSVQVPASAPQTSVISLAVSGMNDVLNSQGYTQAAWWNRIPAEAWGLIALMGMCSNVLLGYTLRRSQRVATLLVLPVILSISFELIADIDSPRWGLVRVHPQNLVSLSHSLRQGADP
jgi:hypothetical protein